jgi:undecaprenyl-diphosphatase
LNPYLLSAFLGVVEGLTEFLPVSSTAHLRIVEALAGIRLDDGFWKMYSVVIQLGAILCLPLYFRDRLIGFLRTFPRGSRGRNTAVTHPIGLTGIAFFCTMVPAFVLTKLIGDNLESLTVIGWSLLVGGVLMWLVDVIFGEPSAQSSVVQELEGLRPIKAAFVGVVQMLAAVFPGTSRSMATISAGQIAGLSRPAALEFSFLLSIPTMAAAVAYDFLKTMKSGEVHLASSDWVTLAIGFVVSFVVAYAVVAWFMAWVRRHGFQPFAIYRIVAGLAVLLFMR